MIMFERSFVSLELQECGALRASGGDIFRHKDGGAA